VLKLSPSQWSLVKALAKRSYTISHSRVSEVWSRGSSTHELARSRVVKGACVKALVIALRSRGGEARTLCMFAQVGFPKDLWIEFC
jgi:hypothetical protein